jgi:hypothetical protein
MNKNNTSIPPYLMTFDPGSFAHYTVLNRYPNIVNSVIKSNDYPQAIVSQLLGLNEEISQGKAITPLSDSYPEHNDWNEGISLYRDPTWLGVMWYYSEALFYNRILDITGYYRDGEFKGKDPYRRPKDKQISEDIQTLASVWEQFMRLDETETFNWILHSALWGNRGDLSMSALIDGNSLGGLSTQSEREFILADHTEQVRAFLSAGLQRVDILNDNVGADSIFDLILADFLIQHGWVKQVRLQLKDRPFFISDAMPPDIRQTVTQLWLHPALALRALGQRLSLYLEDGRLELKSHPFLASVFTFRHLPPALHADLASADLLILKGDANYRRLLDERHWSFATPLETATAHFPFPFLAMRTIKCELLAGLDADSALKMERLQKEDLFAFVSGKRGVIQLRPNRLAH